MTQPLTVNDRYRELAPSRCCEEPSLLQLMPTNNCLNFESSRLRDLSCLSEGNPHCLHWADQHPHLCVLTSSILVDHPLVEVLKKCRTAFPRIVAQKPTRHKGSSKGQATGLKKSVDAILRAMNQGYSEVSDTVPQTASTQAFTGLHNIRKLPERKQSSVPPRLSCSSLIPNITLLNDPTSPGMTTIMRDRQTVVLYKHERSTDNPLVWRAWIASA